MLLDYSVEGMSAASWVTYRDPLGAECRLNKQRLLEPSNAWLQQLSSGELSQFANGVWPECPTCSDLMGSDQPRHEYHIEQGIVCCCGCQKQLLDVHAACCFLHLKRLAVQQQRKQQRKHEATAQEEEQRESQDVGSQQLERPQKAGTAALPQRQQQQERQPQDPGLQQQRPRPGVVPPPPAEQQQQCQPGMVPPPPAQQQQQQHPVTVGPQSQPQQGVPASAPPPPTVGSAPHRQEAVPPQAAPPPQQQQPQDRFLGHHSLTDLRQAVTQAEHWVQQEMQRRMQQQAQSGASSSASAAPGERQQLFRRVVKAKRRRAVEGVSRRRKPVFSMYRVVVDMPSGAQGIPAVGTSQAQPAATEPASPPRGQQSSRTASAAAAETAAAAAGRTAAEGATAAGAFAASGGTAAQDQLASDPAPADVISDTPDVHLDADIDPGSTDGAAAAALARFQFSSRNTPPCRTTADVRTAEASNWQQLHHGQPTSSLEWFMRTQAERQDLHSLLHGCLKRHIMDQAHTACCPQCGARADDGTSGPLVEVAREVEVLVVSFTALVSVTLPVLKCLRCDIGYFNLHPFQASCFPSTPVSAVSPLRPGSSSQCPILWFHMDLLQHLLITRQHQPRMGLSGAAAALRQHMIEKRSWDDRLSGKQFERSLSSSLNQFAVLHLALSDPKSLGLLAEGMMCCCGVCKRGHRAFLVQQGVLAAEPPVPLLNMAISGRAGAAARSAADIAAADAAVAAAAGNNSGGGVQGLGGSWLPQRQRPDGWHEALAKTKQNPLVRFEPYAKPLVIHGVSLDGLRRVPHFAKAGTSTTYTNLARVRFVADEFVNDFISFAGKSTAAAGRCHDFDADKQLGRSSKVYDISGIVGMFCRHGHILAAVNMPVGEKWAYAICLLHILMSIHNVWPYVSFYDINCKFKAHFRQFAELRSGWSALLVAWALAMAMPLPPFHVNMHNPECIERNTLKHVDAVGRGAGEPAEIFNRYLGLSGMVLQYASKPVRELWLEVMMLAWRSKKEADLPRLLVSMHSKAVLQERLSLEEQSQLAGLALQYVSQEEVQQLLLPPPPVTGPSGGSLQLTWRAEMAELMLFIGMESPHMLQLDHILPSSLVLGETSKAAALRLKQNRLTALQQEHAQHWSADLNCGEFMEGLAELCLYKVQSLQCVLGDLSRTHLFSLMLQQHIGPLRRQHRKLDKHIETMRSKMDAAIKQLLSWVAHLRLYQQHLRLDDDAVKQAYEAACVSSDQGTGDSWDCMTVGDSSESRAGAASSLKELLCNGEAPWATGAPLTAIQGIGPLAKRMGVVALDIQAANEEKKLVRFEMASLLSSYNQDVLVLQQAVDAASQEISQQLDQQELLIEQLDSSTLSVEQQRDLNCSLASAHNAVSFQLGKRMLLSGRLAGLQRLQAAAEALFVQVTQRANASDDIPLTEDAILAAADEILQHDAEGAADSDDPYGSPDDGDPDPDEFLTAVESESAAAEATAVAGTAADPTRSAELPADMQAAELLAQAVPAPDNAPLAETGLQLWEATADMTRRYQRSLDRLESLTSEQQKQQITLHLTKGSLRTLRPEEELNDEVMNEMLSRILQHNMQLALAGSAPPIHIYNTFFMEKLYLGFQGSLRMRRKLVYDNVARHTLPRKLAMTGQLKQSIFDCRLVVVPCHLPHHWVLVVADLQQQRIIYIDPLFGEDPHDVMTALCRYLELEARFKRGIVLNTSSWARVCAGPQDIPNQTDSHSCGLYALAFTQRLAETGSVGQLASCGINEDTAVAARAHVLCQLTEGMEI